MLTIYETTFYGPTDHRGQRIKVTNRRTGQSRWHAWDYAVNHGIDQHTHAVQCCATQFYKIELAGETKHGWLFITTSEEEE